VRRNFVKKAAAEEVQLAAHAKGVLVAEMQMVEDVEVKIQNEFGFAAGVRELAIGESASNGKQMIGDALHGGRRRRLTQVLGCGTDGTRGVDMRSAPRSELPPNLEGDRVLALLA